MEATLVPPYMSFFRPPQIDRKFTMQNRRRPSLIVSVLTDNNLNTKSSDHDESKTVYNDNWFDRLAINHLSRSLQASTGHRSKKSGYDGLMRKLMPPSKRTREIFAVWTTIFFSWLVGPCEVRESEFEGEKEKNVVYIPKCRFLEETNCVGMCTNLCKMPSQEFIKDTLGTPVSMVPSKQSYHTTIPSA
ncbi:hypothetical protein DH2020_001461 [Rehmannia glutinosa]|uniref:Beta-carotene isomerase D27-like C-terminal domain-containing protein n=1 Tax=Rehmannia glutinosa TaxID=99300 RepID=A0ABR0XZG2_REHGL